METPEMTGTIEARLAELGITLPEAPNPVANYVPYAIAGNQLFISGQISKGGDGKILTGALGDGVSVEEGQAAARLCALNILAQAKAALGGDLNRIVQVMRLTGFVNATATFTDHPKVVNGASDLMVEVLGDKGRHTRAAVGVSGLPLGSAVEVDAIIAIRD
jgi:enamine deaminase RidA (YjgF/YER057c/UK114 family)